jgi:hypothetical protein
MTTTPTSPTAAQVCPVCQRPVATVGDYGKPLPADRPLCWRLVSGAVGDCFQGGFNRLHVALREVFLEGGFLTSNPQASRVSMRDIAEAALGPDCGHNNPAEQERAKVAGQWARALLESRPCTCGRTPMIHRHPDGAITIHCACGLHLLINAALAPKQQPAPAPVAGQGDAALTSALGGRFEEIYQRVQATGVDASMLTAGGEIRPTAPVASEAVLRDALAQARKVIDRDRTGLAAGLAKVRRIVGGYVWLGAGEWGSYSLEERTEKTLRAEIATCLDQVNVAAGVALNDSGNLATRAVLAIDAALASTPAGQPDEALRSAFDSGWLAADARHETQADAPAGQPDAEVKRLRAAIRGAIVSAGAGLRALETARGTRSASAVAQTGAAVLTAKHQFAAAMARLLGAVGHGETE